MKFLYQLYHFLLIAGVLGLSLNVFPAYAGAQSKSAGSFRLLVRFGNFNAEVLKFSPDSKRLANGMPGIIQIWDARQRKLLRTLRDEKLSKPFSFSPDGKNITVCTTDHRVQIWSIATAKPLKTLGGFRTHMFFSQDGSLMAGWSMKNGKAEESTKIWDTRTGCRLRAIDNITSDSDQYVFSRDNKVMVIASVDNFIKIYDVKSGRLISDKDAFGDISPPIVLSPDGKLFATIAVGSLIGDDPMSGSDVRPATDGGLPVSYSAKIWNARTGRLIREFGYWENWQDSTAPLGFTADGTAVLYKVGDDFGEKHSAKDSFSSYVNLFNVTTGKLIVTFNVDSPVILSPSGKVLLSGKKDLNVWTLQ